MRIRKIPSTLCLWAACLGVAGCVDMQPMYDLAAWQGLANAANQPMPGGREQPLLSADETAIYQAVSQYYRSWADNPATFALDAALPCNIDQNTGYLLATHQSEKAALDSARASDRVTGGRTQMQPLNSYLLSGQCASGTIEGPFVALVTYSMQSENPTSGTSQMNLSLRIEGELRDGQLQGDYQSISRFENSNASLNSSTTVWTAESYRFSNSQPIGTSMTYTEFPQFNSLSIYDDPFNNGLRRVRSFTGKNRSNTYYTFDGVMYGWFIGYVNNQVSSRSCMWRNQTAVDEICTRFQLSAPLAEFVGVGLRLPSNLSGRFQIAGVIYPSGASQAGLMTNDTVLAINGVTLTAEHDTDYVVAQLRGELGTSATLTVLAEGEAATKEVQVARTLLRTPALPD